MIGKPKFKEGDLVSFKLGDKQITGKVFVVDKWGIFCDTAMCTTISRMRKQTCCTSMSKRKV